ncbi:alpha/beta-Hydrolases superfamily protein [Striga asiatica]|uniref:Alpha/beta-Hydrolases superfamily protein n=1 Tax=Striga asiatica TaxID=4170 RepID=A0A5A7R7Z9_STRAF|nr:alpha/beta-Hydrolases superfamily protein [Striga asiatica]
MIGPPVSELRRDGRRCGLTAGGREVFSSSSMADDVQHALTQYFFSRKHLEAVLISFRTMRFQSIYGQSAFEGLRRQRTLHIAKKKPAENMTIDALNDLSGRDFKIPNWATTFPNHERRNLHWNRFKTKNVSIYCLERMAL